MSSAATTTPRLHDKVAIITGAGGGVGRATAHRFANEGCAVVCSDIVTEANDATAQQIIDQGGRAVATTVDVTNDSQMKQLVDLAESTYGGLDILFNNAGVMLAGDDDAVSTADDIIERTLDINVRGVLLGCRHGIPALRRRGGGAIVNTASFVASVGAAAPQIAYTASKGAVLALTRELAVVHARENIRVNAVSPGPLRTELLMSFLDTEDKKQRRLVHVPMGRFGESEEVAQVALFLASVEASYVTGANINVDGGLTAAYVTPE
jgi:NAD(P)-dependent dehydrogenase (short-subunit alcohol dehydrogenase family)